MTDQLGSAHGLMDQSGNMVWWADYEAFGKAKGVGSPDAGAVDEVPRFTGKAWDEKVGLYYFNARWYDSGMGRFISEDPIRDGLNWNCYVNNNPLSFIDPLGTRIDIVTAVGWSTLSYNQARNVIHAHLEATSKFSPTSLALDLMGIPVVGLVVELALKGLDLLAVLSNEMDRKEAAFCRDLDSVLIEYEEEIKSGDVTIMVETVTVTTVVTPDGNPFYNKQEKCSSTTYNVKVVDGEGNIIKEFSGIGVEDIMGPNLTTVIPERVTEASSTHCMTERFSPPPTLEEALESL